MNIRYLIGAVAAAFVLAGCGSTAATTTTTHTHTHEMTDLSSGNKDAIFLTTIRSEYPATFGPSFGTDQQEVDLAHTLCEYFDVGKTLMDAANMFMTNSDLSVQEAGYFMGAAVQVYCPEHMDVFQQ